MTRSGEWLYRWVFEGLLHEGFAGSSGSGINAQGFVDGQLGWFGAGRFAHVQGAPFSTAEGSGDALLSLEDAA